MTTAKMLKINFYWVKTLKLVFSSRDYVSKKLILKCSMWGTVVRPK